MSLKGNIGVLVAEPSPQVVVIIKKILEENEYKKITFTRDVDTTLAELRKHETDIALLDFNLATADTYRLIDEVVLDKHIYRLPMVLMGSNAPMGIIDEAMRLGAREYINKPFTPYLLMVRLEKIIFGPPKKIVRRKEKAGKAISLAAEMAKGGEGLALEGEVEEAAPSPAVVQQQALAKKLFLDGHKLMQTKQFDKAIKRFAAAARVNTLFPEAYKGLAEVFRSMGHLDRSSQFLSKAAETYAWLGNDDEATKTFEVSRKMDPAAPNPYKTVGDHLNGHGRPQEVTRVYERAVKLSPKDAGARVALSRAYADSGHKEKAAATLKPMMGKGEIPEDMRHLIVSINREGPEPKRTISFADGVVGGGDGVEKRRFPRISLAEYSARLPKKDTSFAVVDASRVGISFKHNGQEFALGEKVAMDLITIDGVKLKKLKAIVRRTSPLVVGLEITGLTNKQKKILDTIVPAE